ARPPDGGPRRSGTARRKLFAFSGPSARTAAGTAVRASCSVGRTKDPMDSALVVHRLHFAFTATFHYLFPQLTMGLAPLIVVLKVLALRRPDRRFDEAARLL